MRHGGRIDLRCRAYLRLSLLVGSHVSGWLAAARDGLVKPSDLENREQLRSKLTALLASAATNEINKDLLTTGIWAWKVDRRSGVIDPDYGVPASFSELQDMVKAGRLKGRRDVDDNEESYFKYITNKTYVLEKKNWVTYRNPGALQKDIDAASETTSSTFFEKNQSRKKSPADYMREASRMARDVVMTAFSHEDDTIQVLRNAVKLGNYHSLSHMIDRITKSDGTLAEDGSRTLMKTVKELRRLAKVDTSKISICEKARLYLNEFITNLCIKSANEPEKTTKINLFGEEVKGDTDEKETLFLSRCALAMALVSVDDDMIKSIEHEFVARTQKNSTPTALRDNIETFLKIVEREENKCAPKQRVRAIEDKPAETDNSDAEKVARVFHSGGRGRGGGRGGRGGRGGGRQNDRKGGEAKRSSDENQAQKKGENREKPCHFCLAWNDRERYDHKPSDCWQKKRIKAAKKLADDQKPNYKERTESENVKTVNDRRVTGFDRYDSFENGHLGFNYE